MPCANGSGMHTDTATITGSSLIASDSPRSCNERSVFLPRIPGTQLESSHVGLKICLCSDLFDQTRVDLNELDSVTAPAARGNLFSTPN
jgi:hypothetical protein